MREQGGREGGLGLERLSFMRHGLVQHGLLKPSYTTHSRAPACSLFGKPKIHGWIQASHIVCKLVGRLDAVVSPGLVVVLRRGRAAAKERLRALTQCVTSQCTSAK